ncbi:MAG: LysR family transcriptional regulator [Novosphingobium sp.]|nr:LysR family transcriptional regulator [Novosphingobium sp.]MCP5403533.1 LysR family transcriptional regulator [Novosphingobium sp.]
MHVSLTRLRHILAVARTGSFSLAAEEEGISQPALSRSIQAFEAEYEVRLFDRSRGGATLTAAGALAVEHARNVLAAAGELDRNMSLIGKGEAGRVGVGFGPLVASLLLPGLGKQLMSTHPNLQLVSKIRPADQLLDALVDGTVEAIIGNSGHLSQIPGVVQEQLGTLELGMAVRRNHPLGTYGRLTMEDLAAFPVASAVEGPNGFAPGHTGAFVSENFHILREVVLETNCVWLTSPLFIANDIHEKKLVQLQVSDLQPSETDIWVAFRRGRSRSPMLDMLVETVAEMLATDG